MPRFRKKPVIIEAFLLTRPVVIETLEGQMIGESGDRLITGVDGEQYPCPPDVFEQSYEPLGGCHFRKRPVIVEAVPLTRRVTIDTSKGQLVGEIGDWFITGTKGEHYPCKPDIFEQTYEPVDDKVQEA